MIQCGQDGKGLPVDIRINGGLGCPYEFADRLVCEKNSWVVAGGLPEAL